MLTRSLDEPSLLVKQEMATLKDENLGLVSSSVSATSLINIVITNVRSDAKRRADQHKSHNKLMLSVCVLDEAGDGGRQCRCHDEVCEAESLVLLA